MLFLFIFKPAGGYFVILLYFNIGKLVYSYRYIDFKRLLRIALLIITPIYFCYIVHLFKPSNIFYSYSRRTAEPLPSLYLIYRLSGTLLFPLNSPRRLLGGRGPYVLNSFILFDLATARTNLILYIFYSFHF